MTNVKKIIVPKKYLQAQEIGVNPYTFEPKVIVVLDQKYYNTISLKYNINNIYADYSYVTKWLNETVDGKNAYDEYNSVAIEVKIGNFIELDENSYNYHNISKWVDSMYNFNNGHIIPVVIDVSEKETQQDIYSVRCATTELCKRYIEILSPLKDIEKDSLEFTSNNHLIDMCQTIIDNTTLPEDKISRWLGFIQGVMVMKGYTTVNIERDFSRPLFHKVYKTNNIDIPKNTL